MSDTILKWDYPRTIPAKFFLIWLDGFREEDLNEIFYQNALVQAQMSSNFNCSYMARSSLTYILDFFGEIFPSADLYRLCKLGIFCIC
jgi:hypothetical protein